MPKIKISTKPAKSDKKKSDKTKPKGSLTDPGALADRARQTLFDSLYLDLNQRTGNMLPPSVNAQHMKILFPQGDPLGLILDKKISSEKLLRNLDPLLINEQKSEKTAKKEAKSMQSVIQLVSSIFGLGG